MFLNFLDPVDRLIILHKTYETEEIDILTNLIKDNSIKKFIDIGANCGFYTFKFARQNMEIYSFEPNIDALNKIKNTLNKNEYLKNKIKIFPYGISDCNSKLEMVSMIKHGYVQTGGSGVVSSKKPKGNNFKFYEAEFKIGDELLDFQNDNLAIKIDVEGHELNVLKGISNLLKKNKCIVQIEIFKKNFDEINSYLTKKGYYVKDKFEKRSNYFYSNYQ
jgi:FkbM family methyltransferase